MFLSADQLQAIYEQANSEVKALPDALQLFVEHMANRTDNQLEQAQERILEFLRERQSSQKSANGLESAYGKWPGEETDEEIDAALEELS